MEQNNPSTTPSSTPTPVTPAPIQSTPSQNVVKGSSPKHGASKKSMIMILLLIVILVVLGAIGYYYYSQVMNKATEITAAISPEPTVAPSASPDQINDEAELDGIVSDLDNATDEANMSQEANSLQSDSNF